MPPDAKKIPKNLVVDRKTTTFATAYHPMILGLSYGVMVAQQVLVLFVVVRIRLGQQRQV